MPILGLTVLSILIWKEKLRIFVLKHLNATFARSDQHVQLLQHGALLLSAHAAIFFASVGLGGKWILHESDVLYVFSVVAFSKANFRCLQERKTVKWSRWLFVRPELRICKGQGKAKGVFFP